MPQATLARVRAVVDACAGGATTAELIGVRTDIAPRHVAYAVAAARSLELIRRDPESLRLTALGERMARSVPSSEDERLAFQEAVAGSAVLTALVPDLLGDPPPDRDSLTARIVALSGLSEETAAHRAAMILQWRTVLIQPQLRLFR